MRSLTRDEVRAVDKCAMETLGVPGLILMENAGRNAAEAITGFLGGDSVISSKKVGIVAGAGNNGGDGFVIARHLALAGAAVRTFVVAPPEKISGDARTNYDAVRSLGLDVTHVNSDELPSLAGRLAEFDLVVDAAGGTGIRGELRGDLAVVVEQINASGKSVVAVDIPTGLDCDSGEVSGPAVRAKLAVSFVARKKGFDNPASREYTGEVVVADIGIDALHVAREAGLEV